MTNKKPLIDKLLDKWAVKVICLIIAIALYIFHQASLIDKKTFILPLNIIENGIVTHVGNNPGSVSVVVRANPNDIKLIQNSDMHAYINLDTITDKGIYNLPVSLILSEKLLELDPFEVKIKTANLNIEVDKKSIKYVPLVPTCIGEVAHGYTVSEVLMTPSVVQITGPASVLDAIDEINTTKINVSNAETTFSTDSYYMEISKLITVDDKGPYRATVVVSPLDYKQEYSNIPIEVINLNKNLEVITEIPFTKVVLAGTMPGLEALKLSSRFAQLDLSDINEPGEYEITVKYNVPSNFELVSKTLNTINVSIKEVLDDFSEDKQETESSDLNEKTLEA